ncbi:ORF151 [Xestia c-nigrum granulovirus]|uniref:ORF151 n=1 Tax=Xestia c-nigrum granulosis virus TaxID=51677 RepID=Q9PYP5_GVXN|nr:ORF151 [Xestia c-nigrum granulovirus]AAF05265.1 ORF151 [Xestia c-nigrum granulovirus]
MTSLLLIMIIAVIVLIYAFRIPPQKEVVTAGPTCNTFLVNGALHTCPDKYEFNSEKLTCVPIDETGCTATEVPTTITRSETVCTDDIDYARTRFRPCQVLRSCVNGETTISREGYCFQRSGDGQYEEVECMMVPGCRYLDAVHVPTDSTFGNETHKDEVVCPAPAGTSLYRNADQPCFSSWICASGSIDNTQKHLIVCNNDRCQNDLGTCVACDNFERCVYQSANTPLTAIVNS